MRMMVSFPLHVSLTLHSLPMGLSDTDGLSKTSPITRPKTFMKTITVEKVWSKASRVARCITDCDLVPKFQGENFYANKRIAENFKALARRKGCPVTQVALAWAAAEGIITIPGTTKPERLDENWASRDVEITEEDKIEMRTVIKASKPQGDRYNEQAAKAIGN